MHDILGKEKIHDRAIRGARELVGANNKIDALHKQLVIFVLRTLTWC